MQDMVEVRGKIIADSPVNDGCRPAFRQIFLQVLPHIP